MRSFPFSLPLLLLWVLACAACSQTDEMASPNGKVVLTPGRQADGSTSLTVTYVSGTKQTEVIQISAVGIRTRSGRGVGMRFVRTDAPLRLAELYPMLTGKRLECSNEANEYLCHFRDSLDKEVLMRIRLYNDGVAFRYELPELQDDRLADEQTTYRLPEGVRRWMQPYTPGYEGFYPMVEGGHTTDQRRWGYPALAQPGEDLWVLMAESDVNRLQSGSLLANEESPTDYRIEVLENNQPLHGQWHTPSRVLIAGTLSDVVASTLITDTSQPCGLTDTSWIRPGSVSWIYWAHNHGSKDFQLIKQYIDMAVQLKLPYVLIDWEWDIMGNGGTIEDAVRYANERQVRVLMWYNSSTTWVDEAAGPLFRLNTPEQREKEFAWLRSIGVAGVKIDFFPEDTEPTMAYYQDLLETAAKYHLLVNFHGAAIPRGWQRTWPHLMTVEAVYGAEWYNNKPVLTTRAAAHNATLPFTRNVIGSMDYTPCTFSDSQHPHITTHAHELALPILFESGLQHWADRPESYLSQPDPVQRLMGELPTVWEESRLLSGYPTDHAVMARRSGNTWYVAGINGTDTARPLSIDWSFLPAGRCQLTLFEDSGHPEENPWHISQLHTNVTGLPATLPCQPRGGFVAVVSASVPQ